MNKMQIAHEWAIELLKSGDHSDDVISCAWRYADAMQAEADKREDRTRPAVLNMADSPQLEWQPDWSQAPAGYNWFCVGSNGGYGFFSNQAPELFKDYYFVGADGFVVNNHGYQGNWQDSLRKRPQ